MAEEDDTMEALFDGLSPRQVPPTDARERAFAATYQVFEAERSQRRLRGRALLIAAACLLIALMLTPRLNEDAAAFDIELADATSLELNGDLLNDAPERIQVSPGTQMRALQAVRLTVAPATDLRLAAGTVIRWQGAERIELEQGTVYVDTREIGDMAVITSVGSVTDIGTRFLVSYTDDQLEVAMRSGRTQIESKLGQHEASADDLSGDVVTISAERVSRRSESTDAARWQWINAVPRGYDETRVQTLLEQVARDQGLSLAYADAGTRAWVMNMELKGDSLDRLTPAQAMEIIAIASDTMISVRSDRTLYVSRR